MTDKTDAQEEAVAVEQIDREAACSFADWHEGFKTQHEVDQLAKAMAIHRLATLATIDNTPAPDFCAKTAQNTPAPDGLARLREIVAGIDQTEGDADKGWWETSTGAAFGAERLAMLEELVTALRQPPASAWQGIESTPLNTPVRVQAGQMTFLARLVPDASMNEDGRCDQWRAEIEGEHPHCWTGGACWSSNEDEVMSLQPTHWLPAPPATIPLADMDTSGFADSGV